MDLGGQIQYTELHLKDPGLFSDVHTLIYVIDVQDTKKIDFTKNYLLDILDKLKNNKEHPYISIFLHKYDPELQDALQINVQMWIEWVDSNLSKIGFDYSYFLTSIRDESARESFARTLLFTLPYWFLTLTIREDLIIRSFNSLTPIIEEIKETMNSPNTESIDKELFEESVLFGISATKIIIKKWLNHLINPPDKINIEKDADNIMDMMMIKFNNANSVVTLKFKCPLIAKEKFKDISDYTGFCEITHGVITGLSQSVKLGNVEIQETQIRNKSEFCVFNILI